MVKLLISVGLSIFLIVGCTTDVTAPVVEETEKKEMHVEEKEKVTKDDEKTEKEKEEKKTKTKEAKKTEIDTHRTEEFKGEFTSTIELSVRQEPSLDGKRISVISPGAKVTASEKTKNEGIVWYKVKVSDQEGWSSSNYLVDYATYTEKKKKEVKGEKKVTQTKNKQDQPKKKDKPNTKKSNYTIEKASGEFTSTMELNVRAEPSLSAAQVTILSPGTKATASAKAKNDGITWYKVNVNGSTGWASAGYLIDYSKKDTVQPKTNTNNTNTTSNSKKYEPNTIYFGGKAVPYQNAGQSGGQNVIDTTNNASTWGGAATFSGTDDLNTHFIGHNGGRNQFGGMHEHSEFIVTDSSGRAYRYVKTSRYLVDERANIVDSNGNITGANKWDRIVGTGGGERITLQSTYNHPIKWIVEATLDGKVN